MSDEPKKLPTAPGPPATSPAPTSSASAPSSEVDAGPPVMMPPADEESRILQDRVVEVMRSVYDPEIPVNIFELGMIYGVDVTPPGDVMVRMTLTSPSCPVAGSLPGEVEQKVRDTPGVKAAKVDLVWEPPWTPEKMTEAAKLQLGMM